MKRSIKTNSSAVISVKLNLYVVLLYIYTKEFTQERSHMHVQCVECASDRLLTEIDMSVDISRKNDIQTT